MPPTPSSARRGVVEGLMACVPRTLRQSQDCPGMMWFAATSVGAAVPADIGDGAATETRRETEMVDVMRVPLDGDPASAGGAVVVGGVPGCSS